jgi:hypothetical protein
MPGTVSVGCKLPAGMILQTFKMEDRSEPVMGGGVRTVKMATISDKRVRLNGWSRFVGQDVSFPIVSGAGITHGVDADFFAEWLKQNADSDVVKNGFVFAQDKPGETKAQARDHVSLQTGLERIDPENLPGEFKKKITTADRPK